MLYTLQETAKKLNISYDAVRNLKDTGQLPVVHLGPRTIRIHADEINRFIEKNTVRSVKKCQSTKETGYGTFRLVTADDELEKRLGKTRPNAKH